MISQARTAAAAADRRKRESRARATRAKRNGDGRRGVQYNNAGASARAARNATETRLERMRAGTPVFVAAAVAGRWGE